jgi:O-antigen/teichoic acid export membrane protein
VSESTPTDEARSPGGQAPAPDIEEVRVFAETDTPEVRIGAGSALTLTAQVLGLGTSFIVGVLVARIFGVEGKGVLSVVMQVPGLLIVILDFGITTSTLYFISRGQLRAGTAAANVVLLAAIVGLLGAPIVYVFLAGPAAIVRGVPPAAVMIAMTMLPLGLLASWASGVSIGLSDLVPPLWYAISSSVTTLIGLFVLVAIGGGSLTAVVAVSAIGTAVGVAVLFFLLRRRIRPFKPDLPAARSMAGFSAKAYTTNIAGLLHERQDLLLLGWLAGSAAVGLYSVGVSFAQLTWYVPSALSGAILAKGSRRDEASGVDYTTRTARIAIVFMGITIAVSLVAVPFIVPLVYGKAFAPAVFSFFALLPGVLADGVSRVLWSYQTTRGRLYWQLALGTTVLNIVAVVALVPFYGAVGAGLASTVSYSVLGVLTVRWFCSDTGASPSDVLVPRRSDVEIIVRTLKRLVLRRDAA